MDICLQRVRYLAPNSTIGHCTAIVSFGRQRLFLLIEPIHNSGMSITNASKTVIATTLQQFNLHPVESDRWFEAYACRLHPDTGADPMVAEIVYPGGAWRTVIDTRPLNPLFSLLSPTPNRKVPLRVT